MIKHKILVIEDISSLALTYAGHLEQEGFESIIAESLSEADRAMQRHGESISGIILDLQLPDGDGLDWLKRHQQQALPAPVIVSTADSSLNRAISAMREGAYDFMVKPVSPERLVASVASSIENMTPVKDDLRSSKSSQTAHGFIGQCSAMKNLYRQIENIASSKATIFITGESGTGKEVCAEAIHNSGSRSKKPFIAINCGAIPENLLESELFGHLKGSFTGAISDKTGAVQAADGGTLFLDEIGEMDLKSQVKLLRFLQSGSVQPVGATRSQQVDVRIVCATNRNPVDEVKAGRFREDLYYRLAVVPIHIPPLRERGHDIILLANHFLNKFAGEEGKSFLPVGQELANGLLQYPWPGNVRELQNLVRRGVLAFDGPKLDERLISEFAVDLMLGNGNAAETQKSSQFGAYGNEYKDQINSIAEHSSPAEIFAGLTLDEIERKIITAFITESGGSIPKAANALGISPSTIYRKQEKWSAIP